MVHCPEMFVGLHGVEGTLLVARACVCGCVGGGGSVSSAHYYHKQLLRALEPEQCTARKLMGGGLWGVALHNQEEQTIDGVQWGDWYPTRNEEAER
jgi:hypothetical protein